MEEVLRRIAKAGGPLDQVEIACPRPEQAALVWEKAQRHEWPVTIGPGIPVALTRPGRGLLAFCEWVAGGLAASRLRRMLQSGDVRLEADGLTAGPGGADPGAGGGHVGAADVRGRARPAHRAPPGAGRRSRAIRSGAGVVCGTGGAGGALPAVDGGAAGAGAGTARGAARPVARRGGRLREDLRAEGQRAGRRGQRGAHGGAGRSARPRRSDAAGLRRARADPRPLRRPHRRRRSRAPGAPARHDAGRCRPRGTPAHLRDRPGGRRRLPRPGGRPGAARRRAQGHRPGPAQLGGSRGGSALPHRLAPRQPARPRLPELLVPRSAPGARDVPLLGAAAGGAGAEARRELDV